jgi:hypothetical protein
VLAAAARGPAFRARRGYRFIAALIGHSESRHRTHMGPLVLHAGVHRAQFRQRLSGSERSAFPQSCRP